jgi:IS5 family transposase
LPREILNEHYESGFQFYEKVLAQKPNSKNKIYSLHEPQSYCMAKGKDRVQYEYGNKVSIAATHKSNIIVGAVSHEENIYDGHTLPDVINHIKDSRGSRPKEAVCDRGYKGKSVVQEVAIILPKAPLKRDNRYQRDKKRNKCKRRAAIEPIIGHLKSDFRLSRNYLKGVQGDEINLLMSAAAWNMKKWMVSFLVVYFLLKIVLKTSF